MQILIVDDDKSTLTMLRLILSKAGHQITSASDASQALKILKQTRFDWLIVDGQMLPIDGFELAEKAKAIVPNIKIVMVSGLYEAEDISGKPIKKLFSKPIDTDALVSYLGTPIISSF